MKKTMMIAAMFALPVGLSGCDKKSEPTKIAAPEAVVSADAMTNMELPVGSKMGKASGTVTAIDAANGNITLDHGAIPAVGWPAMEMGFSAKPNVLTGIVVGDKVDFEVTVTGNAGEVTKIKKQ